MLTSEQVIEIARKNPEAVWLMTFGAVENTEVESVEVRQLHDLRGIEGVVSSTVKAQVVLKPVVAE